MRTFVVIGPGNAAYFGTNELVRWSLITRPDMESRQLVAITLLAGGLAGIANWLVAIPIDTVKSRWQTNDQYKTVLECTKDLVSKQGFGALFRGLTPALIRAFPANAATLLGVETAKSCLTCL